MEGIQFGKGDIDGCGRYVGMTKDAPQGFDVLCLAVELGGVCMSEQIQKFGFPKKSKLK